MASEFSYLEFNLRLCTGSGCASKTEIQQFFEHKQLQLLYVNSVLDFTKEQWEDPVKYFVDERAFFDLELGELGKLGRVKQANIFVRPAYLH